MAATFTTIFITARRCCKNNTIFLNNVDISIKYEIKSSIETKIVTSIMIKLSRREGLHLLQCTTLLM